MEESFRETLEKLYIGTSRSRIEELAGDAGFKSPNTDVQPVWKFTNTLEAFEKDIKQEQHGKVCFEVGDQARFKKVATEEMKKHQDDIDVDWVPLLEDMKSRKCTISEVQSKHIRVTTEDDYEWDVHPDLLEAMFEVNHEKCFKKGDRVRVRPIDEIRMKPLQHRHGIPWDPELLKAANKRGVVERIEDGRKVYIKTDMGKEILCCRPLLEAAKGSPKRVGVQNVAQSMPIRTRQLHESKGFRQGDEVCVRKDLKDGEMKMLQADHGGWNPLMRTEIGKVGSVVRFYPNGDLYVQMNNSPHHWCFNPECLTLLKRAPFEIGGIVQIKDMPTSKMKSLQEPRGGWVPLMEEMKLKQCTIKQVLPGQVVVKTPDEYIWVLNPDLLEVVPADRVEMKDASSISRCFREGDTVRIVDLPDKEMKELLTHHGISSEYALLAKQKVGQVLEVHRGREVVIQLQSTRVTCCRPILELVKESDVPKDNDEVADTGVEGEKLLEGVMKVTRTITGEINIPVGITLEPITPYGLLKATANGDLSLTKDILKRHPNWVDVMSEDGQDTALIKACVSGSMDTVIVLLENGANVNLENKHGHTPAMIAANRGQYKILTHLLSSGAHITTREGRSVLIVALAGDPTTPSKECVDAVLQKCTIEDMQFKDQDGLTAIHHAAASGKEYAVEELLTRDPDGGRRRAGPQKQTILHFAAQSYYTTPSMLEIILTKGGCDVNTRAHNGIAPIEYAAYHGNLDSVKYLISKGADICGHDVLGHTPLHAACSGLNASATSWDTYDRGYDADKGVNNYLEIISVLIEKGLSLDTQNNDGITPEEMLTDRSMRAAVLALAKKVFKTMFVVNIKSENQSSTSERIRKETFAPFLPSSKDVSSLPDESEMPGDIVELGSTSHVHITQSKLKESMEIKQLRDIFASNGAIITDMSKGSLRLNAVVTTERQLERIRAAYESGELEKKMTKLMITDETTRIAGCKRTLKLDWNSQEFQKGQDFFESTIKTVRKSAWIDHKKSEIIIKGTGVCLEIPSGAIPEGKSEKLTISVLWNGEYPPMTDDQFIIGPRVLLEPEGMRFEKPVTLTIPHSSKNLSANCLKIMEKQSWDAEWVCVFNGTTEGHSKDVQVTSSTVKVRLNHFTLESILQSLSSPLWSRLGLSVSPPGVSACTEPKSINMYAHSHIEIHKEKQDHEDVQDVVSYYILYVYFTLSNDIPDDEKESNTQSNDPQPQKYQCARPQRFSIDPGKAMSITVKLLKPQVGWSISNPTVEFSGKRISKGNCKKEFSLVRTESDADCKIVGTIEGKEDGEPVLDEFHFHIRDMPACNNSAVLDLVPIGNRQCIPSQVQQSRQEYIHTDQAAAAHTPQQQSIQQTYPATASNSTTFPGAASFSPFPGGIAPGIGQTIPGMPKGHGVVSTLHETFISDGRVQVIQTATSFKSLEPAETDKTATANKVAEEAFELKYSDMITHELIGSGSHGDVSRVSFKRLFKGHAQAAAKTARKLFKKEIHILKTVQHSNIVTFFAYIKEGPSHIIVMELAKESLRARLNKEKGQISRALQDKWIQESAQAIQYLHNGIPNESGICEPVVHRDLKGDNCLLFNGDVLKLCDFGIARETDHTTGTTTGKGTEAWMAPELRSRHVFSTATDIYAYGVLIWEITTQEVPQPRKDVNGARLWGQPMSSNTFPGYVEKLLPRCWEKDRDDRPTIKKIILELPTESDVASVNIVTGGSDSADFDLK